MVVLCIYLGAMLDLDVMFVRGGKARQRQPTLRTPPIRAHRHGALARLSETPLPW
jgi:hypothetical protein